MNMPKGIYYGCKPEKSGYAAFAVVPILRACLFIFLSFILLPNLLFAQVNRYAVADGNWDQTSTWSSSSGGSAGASVPVAGDLVFIGDIGPGVNVTIPSGYTAACATLNLGSATNGSSSLSLAAVGSAMNVSGNIIITRPSAANSNILFVNDGAVSVAGSLTLAGSATTANRIAKVSIANGSLSISTDLVFVTGNIISNVVDMSGGTGTLTLGGAFSGTVGTFICGTSGTVIYNKAGNQTVTAAFGDYNRLTLSGSGAKTITGITINDSLSLQGTVTIAGTTPTFGASSTLQYAGLAMQTTGNEFRSPFPGTGGVVINNNNGVVLGANKTVTNKLNMLAGQLDMNGHTLTVGDLEGTGAITTGVAAAVTLTVGSDNLSTAYSGALMNGSGTLSLTKNGSGTFTLSGNSSYSGVTTISTGMLKLDAAGNGTNSPLGTSVGNTVIANGAVLDLNGNSLSIAEPLSLRGTGISNSGALINSSANSITYSGLLTLTNNCTISADAGDINLNNTGAITGSGFTLTINGNGNGSIASTIATGSGKFAKNGTGTWTLSGNNSYTGTTNVNAGTIKLGASATVLGTIANNTVVSAGASLDLNGYTLGNAEPITISGTGTSGEGAVNNSSSTDVEYTGLLKLGSATTIIVDHGAINFSATGTITGGSFDLTLAGSGNGILASIIGTGAGSLIKNGTGRWTLSGASTYNGTTEINAGTIKIGTASGAIPNNSIVTVNGTLDLNGNNETIGSVDGTGIVTSSTAGNVTFAVGAAANTIFATTIEDGLATMNFTKNGAGTMTMAKNNAYSGLTTIAAGILKIGIAGSGSSTALGTDVGGTTITSGAALDMNGYSIQTDEALTIRGTGVSGGGSLTNTSSSAVIYQGLLTLGAASSIVASAGDISLPNTGTINGSGFALTLSGTANGDLAGIINTGAGTLTKSGTGTWTLSGDNTYAGATTISAGTFKLGASTSALGTIAGSTTVINGAVLDLNGYSLSTAEPLTINGSGIASGGALTNNATAAATFSGLLKLGSNSTIVSIGDIDLPNTGTITGSGFDLTLTGTGSGSLASKLGTAGGELFKSGSGSWTISNANTYTGGTTLSAGKLNINNAQALGTVAGPFRIMGGTFDNTSGASITTINYPQTWNGDFVFGGTQDLNLGTGAITMNSDITATINGAILTTAGIISGSTYNLTKAGSGNLYFGAAAVSIMNLYISAGSLKATSGTINIGGDFTNDGILLHNNGLINFNGIVAQEVGGSANTTFYKLTLNNSSGLAFNTGASIGNTLTMTNGNLTINTGVTVQISSGIAIAGLGFGLTKHVVTQVNTVTGDKGILRIGGFTGSMSFPVGSALSYLPLIVNAIGTNDFSVTAFEGATENGQPNGTPFSILSKLFMVDAIWIVGRNSGVSNTTLQASWPAALKGIGFSQYLDAEMGLSRYNGSSWDAGAGSGSQSANNAARNALINFGSFGAGKVGVPLSLNFRSIRVSQINKGLKIDWTVLNETDIDHYEIERSDDGRIFRTIGEAANLSSSGISEANYSYIDFNPEGHTYYYRIKAVDKNGKLTYSTIVRIDLQVTDPSIIIYPNPVQNGQLSFRAGDLKKGNYMMRIYNSIGQQVFSIQLNHPGGMVLQAMTLPRNTTAGFYTLRLEKDGQTLANYNFIVR